MLSDSRLGDFSFSMDHVLATFGLHFDTFETILARYYNKKKAISPSFLEQVILVCSICSSNYFSNLIQRTLYIFYIRNIGGVETSQINGLQI
jgi:hypothetical protein